MADAMDWHPTTPPPTHNPYSHPQYMPGGWPASPPPYRCTADVFAKKRSGAEIERATKRVCTGIRTIGNYAIVKPLYIIIRGLRRAYQTPRSTAGRPTPQSRRLPPRIRAAIAAAELAQAQRNLAAGGTHTTSQQTVTLPQTHAQAIRVKKEESDTQQPTPTSIPSGTNTETPFSARTSPKRKREDASTEESPNVCLQHSTLSSYLVAQSKEQAHPAPIEEPVKKMKKVNYFEAGHKRSPTTHVTRGLVPGFSLKPIGALVPADAKVDTLWGQWQHERPIKFGGARCSLERASIPDEQIESKQESNVSKHDETASEAKGSHSETPPSASMNEVDQIAGSTPLPLDDERWGSSRLVEQFFPENTATEETNAETANLPEAAGDSSGVLNVEKLFHRTKPKYIPPVIKGRPVIERYRLKYEIDAEESAFEPDASNERVSSEMQKQDIQIASDKESIENGLCGEESAIAPPHNTNSLASANRQGAESTSNIDAQGPVTPMKVIAEKPAKKILETPVRKDKPQVLETPVEKLSKLYIKENEDNDTPKATPHSGTKTTRVTRYREALEKAQRAKLEQYEIVPITSEWDEKVREAVRKGIKDYLGPQDLARVVPQYAGRGQDNWLNDETINKYLDLVAAHGRKNDRPDQVKSHHAFNNFFYNNLRQKGASSILNWSKRAKIGGKNLAYVEKVFVPVNSGAHWTLAVVEPTQKKITHYNSMRGSATGIRACEDLKNWVALELGKDFKEDEWTLMTVGESPQQTNSDDCGVFTITSARQIMLGYTPMSYSAGQIPIQRVRIVAELINRGLLRSTNE